MFKKFFQYLCGFFSLIKNFIKKIIENISNFCIICAIVGILYSPLLLLKAENYFDILRFCLIFAFFIVDFLLIKGK